MLWDYVTVQIVCMMDVQRSTIGAAADPRPHGVSDPRSATQLSARLKSSELKYRYLWSNRSDMVKIGRQPDHFAMLYSALDMCIRPNVP